MLEPKPFEFQLEPSILSARAFSLPFRLLATIFVLWIGFWMLNLWQKGLFTPAKYAQAATENIALKSSTFFGLSTQQGWLIAAFLVLAYTLGWIWASRTTLSKTHLQQSWVWRKEMALTELAYVKIIRIRGLDWLIAPRLYARSLLGKFQVFYAAEASMIGQWERLRDELAAFRRM